MKVAVIYYSLEGYTSNTQILDLHNNGKKLLLNLIKEKVNNTDFNCIDTIEQASIYLESLQEFLGRENFNFSLDMTDDGEIIYVSINPPIPDKYKELFEDNNE